MTTVYKGRAESVQTAGNVNLNFMPAVAGFNAKTPEGLDDPKVTVTEWDAGTAFECSTKKAGMSSDPQKHEDQYLCDAETFEEPGSIKRTGEPIEFLAGDPQKPDPFLATLVPGATFYIGERFGLDSDAPAAAGQTVNRLRQIKVQLLEYVDPEANSDGTKFQYRLHYTISAYRQNAAMVAAA